ncbi:hypothetical protein U1Q18_013379 [Sarracenia purpurea var. burkii]
MAVRAMNTGSIFRSASSPSLAAFGCRLQFGALQRRRQAKLGFQFSIFRSDRNFFLGKGGGGVRCYSVQSFFETVMEELDALRKRKRLRAGGKMELTSTAELLEDKLDKRALQKGFLLEFKKDSERVLLAVAQRPDGKKNWMVSDQDPSLLECAWVELLEENKPVMVNELAEMIFGSAEPLESYCAHILLSKDEIYFTVLESKGSSSVYGPRSAMQVAELLRRKLAKEAAEKEFQEFVQLLKSVKKMPSHAKPSKSSWDVEEKIRHRIKSLEAYAIDASENDDQKKTAGMLDDALSATKLKDGRIKIWIHVADPASLVQPGSIIDR